MTVLAIGGYSDTDAEALRRDLDAVMLRGLDDLPALDAQVREAVTAVAYQGSAAFGADQMALLPNLRIIANYGVGYDAIDVDAATARGIVVTNTPDVLNDDVADLAVALLLDQLRGVTRAENWLRDGNWRHGSFPLARKVSGRRVGILGLGRIGREIADRLAAFKCEIHYFARSEKDAPGWIWHRNPVSLAEAVDALVVAVVGGAETRNLVDAGVLEALGPDGVLVNIARGSVVDEAALIGALELGRIAGAALDVFQDEPNIDRRFLALPNAVLTPHIGSATVETRAAMGQLQRDNLRAFLDGKPPLTPVNRP